MPRNAQLASVSPFSGLMQLSLECGGLPPLFVPTAFFGVVVGLKKRRGIPGRQYLICLFGWPALPNNVLRIANSF